MFAKLLPKLVRQLESPEQRVEFLIHVVERESPVPMVGNIRHSKD